MKSSNPPANFKLPARTLRHLATSIGVACLFLTGCGSSGDADTGSRPDTEGADAVAGSDAAARSGAAADSDAVAGPTDDPADVNSQDANATASDGPATTTHQASPTHQLSAALLDESLALGQRFLIANQTKRGNFRYAFNGATGEVIAQDNQVRQAGALWGLALVHRARPSDESAAAVLRGLKFYRLYSGANRDGGAFIEYPGEFEGETGAVALVALAAIEMLRSSDDDARLKDVRRQAEQYVKFLLAMRRPDGRFHREYRWRSGMGLGLPSSYFDGETLLALVKAVRYLPAEDLRPLVQESADAMYDAYVVQARKEEPDSELTKGFYQWCSLAMFEMYDAGWEGRDQYASRCIDLAHWMIDEHRTLERRRNTAYAHEGLICAWELARRTGDTQSQRKIGAAIDQGLFKLTTWQFGSPVANDYLVGLTDAVPEARGGVMSARDDPRLRIDTTQHQMHAVILARRYLYR